MLLPEYFSANSTSSSSTVCCIYIYVYFTQVAYVLFVTQPGVKNFDLAGENIHLFTCKSPNPCLPCCTCFDNINAELFHFCWTLLNPNILRRARFFSQSQSCSLASPTSLCTLPAYLTVAYTMLLHTHTYTKLCPTYCGICRVICMDAFSEIVNL